MMIVMDGERAACTAGVQDHSDPGRFRGEPADTPTDVGRPPIDPDERDDLDAGAEVHTVALIGGRTVRWRNCRASITLADAVNRRWPMRDTAYDGTYGDVTHPSRRSDHHPWLVINQIGVVRARCFDTNGIDAGWLAGYLRRLGAAGDPRLTGGYVIFNERITSADFHTWRRYTGRDPHTTRLHVSFGMSPGGFDSPAPWLFLEDTVTPQDLRAVVNGILDTQVPLRSSGRGGHTSLRKVITQLDRAIVPVRDTEPSETHELVERVSTDLAAVRDAITTLAQAATTPPEGNT